GAAPVGFDQHLGGGPGGRAAVGAEPGGQRAGGVVAGRVDHRPPGEVPVEDMYLFGGELGSVVESAGQLAAQHRDAAFQPAPAGLAGRGREGVVAGAEGLGEPGGLAGGGGVRGGGDGGEGVAEVAGAGGGVAAGGRVMLSQEARGAVRGGGGEAGLGGR